MIDRNMTLFYIFQVLFLASVVGFAVSLAVMVFVDYIQGVIPLILSIIGLIFFGGALCTGG